MTKRRDNDLSNGQPTERKLTGPRCSAHKKDGTQCKNRPIRGGATCMKHGGAAKQVREAANQRLLEMVLPALAKLRKIILSPKTSDADAIRAIREVLNRTGFSERFAITVAEDRWGDIVMGSLADDRSGILKSGELESGPESFALEKLAEDESARAWADINAKDEEEYDRSRIRTHPSRVVDGEVVSSPNSDGGLLDRPDPPLGPSEYDG